MTNGKGAKVLMGKKCKSTKKWTNNQTTSVKLKYSLKSVLGRRTNDVILLYIWFFGGVLYACENEK